MPLRRLSEHRQGDTTGRVNHGPDINAAPAGYPLMRPLKLARASDAESALGVSGQYLAGGTVLLDLMKLDVMRPEILVDINDLARDHGTVTVSERGLKLGALVRMAEAAEH